MNDLWEFSITLYAEPNIARQLLDLQDEFGVDVNVALYCIWCGTAERVVSKSQVREMIEACNDWQQRCLMPLRAIRRFLKEHTGAETLYRQAKECELAAERYQQDLLFRTFPLVDGQVSGQLPAESVRRNLSTYLAVMGFAVSERASEILDLLLQDLVDLDWAHKKAR